MAETAYSGPPRWGRAPLRLMLLGASLTLLAWPFLMPRNRRSAPAAPAIPAPAERHQHDGPKTAYEPTDWALASVALIYLATLVLLVISALVLIAAYPNSLPDVDRTLRIAPPGPRLEIDAEGNLSAFRAEEERRLNGYYWIDKQNGIVHIPIGEAMKKLARTGSGFAKGQE